jgi:hypothetical protein
MMVQSEVLKACPFCGTAPERLKNLDFSDSAAFWHPEADCILSGCSIHRDKWQGWNTRTPAVATDEGVVSWQPIETAPKDGQRVDLLLANRERVTDAHWTGASWFSPNWRYDCGSEIREGDPQPTHWIPLPEPPRTALRATKDNNHG